MAATTRQALLDAGRSLNQFSKPGTSWDRSNESDRPGDAFNRVAKWADILEPAGWKLVTTKDEVQYWLRPGATDHPWSATVGYCKKGEVPLLFVFSSSAQPFELERTYTPFAAYALLHHGGDFAAAAKGLGSQGFGRQGSSGYKSSKASSANNSRAPETEEPEPDQPEEYFPEATPWPEPISDLAYHGLIGRLVRMIEPETEADPVAILVQILIMFGNAIGRNAHWQVEGDKHYGNLFACLVGETAKARKGTSKGRALQVFGKFDDLSWRSRIVSGLSSGEGLIWAVRDPIYKRHLVKSKGRVIDTQEVMEDPGQNDKRLLVIESEFARALQSAGREGNTLSPLVREAWDSGYLHSLTKNNQARASNCHVSIIGHITKPELIRTMGDTEATNGFCNRFLWFAVKRSKLLPMGGEPVDFGHFDSQLAELVDAAKVAGEVRFDQASEQLWRDEIYPRLTVGSHGIAAAICNRAEAQVRRIALLYALLDNRSLLIRPEHLLAALAVWDYSEQSVKWIFGDSSGDSVADEIKAALKGAGPRGLSQNDIGNLFGRHKNKARIGQALAILQEGRLIRSEKKATSGRPVTRWFIA